MFYKIDDNVASMKASATLKINELCNQLKADGKTIYNLGLGQSPFPVPDNIVEALSKHSSKKSYLPCKGLLDLRQAVSAFYKNQHGFNITEEQVMIGTGSKIMLFMLQMILDANVILPAPCWVSYAPQAKLFNRQTTVVQTKYENSWKLTAEELLQACVKDKVNLLIFNSPSNPTGQMHNADELKQIAKVAKENNVIIVSDEIYSLLSYNSKHESVYQYYPEGTIISSGLSKWCGAGGWRLGTFVFPTELRDIQEAMICLTSESVSSTCSPVQYAAITALLEDNKHYLSKVNMILQAIAKEFTEFLTDAGIKTVQPQGGFYIYADFDKFSDKLKERGITTSAQLCEALLKQAGVAAVPGSACMQPEEALTARMAFVNFEGQDALDRAEQVGSLNSRFVRYYCPSTYAAITAICTWVKSL
jgi:aspartate aminotransferase